jgi:hypothetical protein
MATAAELLVQIAAVETAIQEFAVNGVAEYYIGPTRVRYYSLEETLKYLAYLQRQLSKAQTGGFTYAKYTRAG